MRDTATQTPVRQPNPLRKWAWVISLWWILFAGCLGLIVGSLIGRWYVESTCTDVPGPMMLCADS